MTLTQIAFVLLTSLGPVQQPTQPLTPSPKQPVMTGVVLTSRNGALRDATVQVRDTTTGTVMTVAHTNAAGEFAFEALPAGSYAVELIFGEKRLIAASTPARVTAGESVAVVLRLPPVPTIDVDSRLNGTLIGASAGGLLGALPAGEKGWHAAAGAVSGGAIGWLIDSLIYRVHKDATTPPSVRVAPTITRRTAGVRGVVRW